MSRMSPLTTGAAVATVATLAASLVIAGPPAPALAADDEVEITAVDDGWAPFQQVFDLGVTEGAVYTAVLEFADPLAPPRFRLWRHALHTWEGVTVVGNPELIGTIAQGPTGLATSDDGVLWASPEGLRVAGDDGSTSSTSGSTPIDSFSGSWYTSGGYLGPVPYERPGAVEALFYPLTSTPPTLPPGAQLSEEMEARTSETAVIWHTSFTAEGIDGAMAVYASALDANGLVGDPVLLDVGTVVGPVAAGLPTGFAASDEVVAWIVADFPPQEHTLRWVSTSDLAAPPSEMAVNWDSGGLALDGTTVALGGVADLGSGPTQVLTTIDLSTGTVIGSAPTSANRVQVHSDVLAWVAEEMNVVHLTSVSGGQQFAKAPRFTDVTWDNPFVRHIDEMAIRGITTGFADGTFGPLRPVTREAMAAFLYRQAGEPPFAAPGASPFADVAPGHPFYAEICWLADQGIAQGWAGPGGTRVFRPGEPVSREAMAAFLHRAAGEPAAGAAEPFVDVGPGHPFAEAIAWLAQTGATSGWSTPAGPEFRPTWSVERQAVAAFLARLSATASG